ncbi:MAG: TIGR02206 family membrane protein [Clostridia bacterium]|nr:TIGR02206 family membrane protein [Clostridia bacterium]
MDRIEISSDIAADAAQDVINQMTQNAEVSFTTHSDEVWCRFFSDGFFGYGAKGDFQNFTLAHFIPIILFGVAIFLIWRFRAFFRNWKFEENFRYIWAAVMMLVEMSYFWRLLYVGSGDTGQIVSLLDKLPLQVCEWTCILACFMIMKKKNNWLFQICFFVCLTAGSCALVVPNNAIGTAGPAYYRYYQFWLEHMLPTLAVLYMVFVHGFRPKFKGIFISAGFLGALGAIALVLNANLTEHNAEYLYFHLFKDIPVIGIPWVTPIFFAVLVFGAFFGIYYLSLLILKLRRQYNEKKVLKSK